MHGIENFSATLCKAIQWFFALGLPGAVAIIVHYTLDIYVHGAQICSYL